MFLTSKHDKTVGTRIGILATECDLNSPNGLYAQKDGTLFILDLRNNKVRKVSTDGTIKTILTDKNGFGLGRGLWVSDDEKIIYYACSNEIRKWTSQSGKSVTYADGFSGLGNIVIDPKGDLVATDRSEHRVYRIQDDGTKKAIAGSGQISGGVNGGKALEMALYGVRAVWFFADGSFLVGTHEGSQVWYIDTLGVINLFLDGMDDDDCFDGDGKNFMKPGKKISEVRSVSMDYEGNVMIVENDQGHIRVVQIKETGIIGSSTKKNFHTTMHIESKNGKILLITNSISMINNLEISLYNTKGKRLITSIYEQVPVGRGSFVVSADMKLSNGCYFLQLQSSDKSINSRNLLITIN